MSDKYRGKFLSVIIQPKIDPKFWLCYHNDNKINLSLMKSSFPLFTEIKNALSTLKVETINGKSIISVLKFAFGTETSVETNIPHYQIYLEFKYLVRITKVYQELNKLLTNRVHIVVKKVYTDSYINYCLKTTSNFQFDSNYYWNKKFASEELLQNKLVKLIDMRPKLKIIRDNYLTGQKLLFKIVTSNPDDRTGIWLADIIGGTGKTAFFQTIIDDQNLNGLYLRVSEGVERLSAKLRKKLKSRLESNRGYPKFIWINFGRTVEENSLKAFADFSEQILDGMLDDNFSNTATGDFVGLPYVNLIVTANTPPNLKHLTGDRLKLLTFFPIYKDDETKELEDSLLIPIYIEIKVRILKRFPNNLDYKFVIRLQNDELIKKTFCNFSWFDELLENINIFKELMDNYDYKLNRRLETKWISASPYNLQSDIYQVYQKALFHSVVINGKNSSQMFIEASSFPSSVPYVYPYGEGIIAESNDLHMFYPIS